LGFFATLKKANLALSGFSYPFIQAYRNLAWGNSCETLFFLSFDVDYKKDEDALPQLARLLRKHDVRASFACVGSHIERRPEPYRTIFGEGHELINHSHTHPHNMELSPNKKWSDISRYEKKIEVERSQEVFEKKVGLLPKGFRLPHFGSIQKDTDDEYYTLLAECGFIYSSSMLDFGLKGKPWLKMEPSGIIELGITTCPFHPFTAMDSYHIMRSKRLVYRFVHSRVDIRDSIKRSVKLCQRRRLPVNVYLDPLDMGSGLLDHVLSDLRAQGIRFMRYEDFIRTL
jgi:hypothetical protein